MAPPACDATVGQLRRTVSAYSFADTPAESPVEEEPRVDFGHTDTGSWRGRPC
jgi:hypothetical protein